MEALLIDEWLAGFGGEPSIPVLDDASVSLVRERVRAVGADVLAPAVVEELVLVASELARNQLVHAVGGRIAVRRVTRGSVAGLEVRAVDRGRGIADVRRALEGRPKPSGSLGVGLAAAREMSDELDIDVRVGEGTMLCARRFAAEVPRPRQVGIYGRPIPGEARNGDHACFAWSDHALTVGVCDGLGHGPRAREASSAAVRVFQQHEGESPAAILEACNAGLHRTRGAVMAVASIDDETGSVELASVGNVTTEVVGRRTARRFGGSSFVLGTPQRVKRVLTERWPLRAGDALVMFSDGVSSRLSIEHELELLREHPVVIAETVLREHARPDDDVLVLVVR